MGIGTSYSAVGCRPARRILKTSRVYCDECPFPFCIEIERNTMRNEFNEQLTRILHKLGNTMEKTAEIMSVSLRSTYRYTSAPKDTTCPQCNMIHSQDVACKSDTCCVVRNGEQYTIVLNKHKLATPQESSIMRCFTSYLFPSSIYSNGADNQSHDYWLLDRVVPSEAENFERMCDNLNKYHMSLIGYTI